MRRWLALLTFFLAFGPVSCGAPNLASSVQNQTSDLAQPVLRQILPNPLKASGTIEIQGVGFSQVPQENVILIGNQLVVAESYSVLNTNNEAISAHLPADLMAGSITITVLVNEVPSNSLNTEVR